MAASREQMTLQKSGEATDEPTALNLTAESPKHDAQGASPGGLLPPTGPGEVPPPPGPAPTPPAEPPPGASPPSTDLVWESPFNSRGYRDEPERTAELQCLGQLWCPPDGRFDHITKCAGAGRGGHGPRREMARVQLPTQGGEPFLWECMG